MTILFSHLLGNFASVAEQPKSIINYTAQIIAEQWPDSSDSTYTHTVVLIGGFQGSGKSVLATVLMEKAGFSIISTDKIRYLLVEQNHITAENVKRVEECLLLQACNEGRSLVVDANCHSSRLAKITDLLLEYPKYRVIKLLLLGSETILAQRVSLRQPETSFYNGTLVDLDDSMKKHHLKKSQYNFIFDIEETSAQDISKEVLGILEKEIRPAKLE